MAFRLFTVLGPQRILRYAHCMKIQVLVGGTRLNPSSSLLAVRRLKEMCCSEQVAWDIFAIGFVLALICAYLGLHFKFRTVLSKPCVLIEFCDENSWNGCDRADPGELETWNLLAGCCRPYGGVWRYAFSGSAKEYIQSKFVENDLIVTRTGDAKCSLAWKEVLGSARIELSRSDRQISWWLEKIDSFQGCAG